MTVQAAIESELPYLRSEAEARMTLTLDAFSGAGGGVDADGLSTTLASTPQGSTVGRLAGSSANVRDTNTTLVDVGGEQRPVMSAGLHIPPSATLPERGWEYVVTAVGDLDDPSLVGRRFRVVDVPAKSQATARRLDVVEVS